jgi:hypothetical protein
MPRVESEPTTPVFEQAKRAGVLDRAATAIGRENYFYRLIYIWKIFG